MLGSHNKYLRYYFCIVLLTPCNMQVRELYVEYMLATSQTSAPLATKQIHKTAAYGRGVIQYSMVRTHVAAQDTYRCAKKSLQNVDCMQGHRKAQKTENEAWRVLHRDSVYTTTEHHSHSDVHECVYVHTYVCVTVYATEEQYMESLRLHSKQVVHCGFQAQPLHPHTSTLTAAGSGYMPTPCSSGL